MCAIGEVDDDLGTIEKSRPVGVRTDITDSAKLGAGYRFRRTPGDPEDSMTASDEPVAHRAADKPGCAGD
jgi:hypothetical protein